MGDLWVGLIAGAFGTGYFIYGKRQGKTLTMLAGVLLCVYPYVIDGLLWQCVIGVLLVAAPFVLDR